MVLMLMISADVSMEDIVDGINGTTGLGGDIVASTDASGRLLPDDLYPVLTLVTEDEDDKTCLLYCW